MIVAIHQPNYAPWLGYFAKMARADVFVLLDDVQYSKNSYINRVQIDLSGKPRWLTVPVHYRFGDAINAVRAAEADWPASHLDTLRTAYADAPAFAELWPWLKTLYDALPQGDLAAVNAHLIAAFADKLGIRCRLLKSSDIPTGAATGDDRLLAILKTVGGDVTYLSGKGGADYQDPAKFAAAGVALTYSEFAPKPYEQGHQEFLPGLSVLDALFRLGAERTASLVKVAAVPA
jgi:hypothetical protein